VGNVVSTGLKSRPLCIYLIKIFRLSFCPYVRQHPFTALATLIFELTSDYYLHFQQNTLPLLLKGVPLQSRLNMWLNNNSAPPVFGLQAAQYLNRCNGNRWIGRGGPHAWPARYPDFTPLDFFLSGYMADLGYEEKSQLRRMMDGAAHESNHESVRKATLAVLKRACLCISMHVVSNSKPF
jgi:hypothetical protein